MQPDEPSILGVRDVAKLTGLTVSTLYTWRNRGLGPESFRMGGRVVYRASVVKEWIAKQEAATARGGAA